MRLSIALAALLCLVLAGCKDAGVVGKWRAGSPMAPALEFTAKGRVSIRAPGRFGSTWYKIEGDQMMVGHLQPGAPDEKVKFKVSGDTLTIGTSLALGTMGTTTFKRVQDR